MKKMIAALMALTLFVGVVTTEVAALDNNITKTITFSSSSGEDSDPW